MSIHYVTSRVQYPAIQATDPEFLATLDGWGFRDALAPEAIAELMAAGAWLLRSPTMPALLVVMPEDFEEDWAPAAAPLPTLDGAVHADLKLTWTAADGWHAEIFIIRPDSTSLGEAIYTGSVPDYFPADRFSTSEGEIWLATDDPAMPKWMHAWVTGVCAGAGVTISHGV